MSSDMLISLVYQRRALWDQKDKNHHNRYILDKMWEQVAVEMDTTNKNIRNKWKNLRDKFRIELQKERKRKSGDGTEEYDSEEGRASTWQYFAALSFLKDQFTPRQNKGNLDSTATATASASATLDPAMLDPEENLFNNTIPPPSPSPSPSGSHFRKRSNARSRTYSDDGRSDIISELVKIEEKKLKMLSEEKDADMQFFESLIPHMKQLPNDKKMLLMMDIHRLVYQHVYGMPPSPFFPSQNQLLPHPNDLPNMPYMHNNIL